MIQRHNKILTKLRLNTLVVHKTPDKNSACWNRGAEPSIEPHDSVTSKLAIVCS